MAAFVYRSAYSRFRSAFLESRRNTVSTLAAFLSDTGHSRLSIPDSRNIKEYNRQLDLLRREKSQLKDITYLYTISYDPDNGGFKYILDGSELQNDTLWIETENFALEIRVRDNADPLFIYNRLEYTGSLQIIYGDGILHFEYFKQGHQSLIKLNGQPFFTILPGSHATFQFSDGTVVGPERRLAYLPGTNPILPVPAVLTYGLKGGPESDPGNPYVDTPENLDRLKNILQDGIHTNDEDIKNDIYGQSLSFYGIIRDRGKPTGLVIADVYSDKLREFRTLFIHIGLGASGSTLLVILTVTMAVSGMFLKPLRNINQAIDRVTAGDLSARAVIKTKDEFGRLAEGFNTMTARLKREIGQMKEAAAELSLTARVFDCSHEGIVILDSAQRVVRANTSFYRITGYRPEEINGKNLTDLTGTWKDDNLYAEMWQNLVEKGIWQGEVWDRCKDGRECALLQSVIAVRGPDNTITNYLSIFEDMTEKKLFEQKIEQLAYTDPLTGLPNRALFNDRLNQALAHSMRSSLHFAIVFLDLDNFKKVNDSLGHHTGDLLLKSVAGRLITCLRRYDTCSRLGGDEFTLLLSEIDDTRELATIAGRLVNALNEPYLLDGQEIFITGSIGISVFPDDGTDLESLVRNADTAMYHAKETGKNNYKFYTEKMNRETSEKLKLEASLHNAIRNRELSVVYQPQIDLSSGEVNAVEALLRWDHPQYGSVEPNRFIPLAEETGLIVSIGEWTLRQACSDIARINRNLGCNLRVAVNLSIRQLKNDTLNDLVESVLSETGLDPRLLELELTESLFFEDLDTNKSKLGRLKKLGIALSIDDFGTGYSSLSYLKKVPLDRLKIDRSFVSGINENQDFATITNAVITLAHSLELSVIAEGVETEDQLVFLLENGCDLVQGFYFSRPLNSTDLISYMENPEKLKEK